MEIFWFIMTCVFFYLWINKKPAPDTNNVIVESKDDDTVPDDFNYRTGEVESQETEQAAVSRAENDDNLVLEEVVLLSPEDQAKQKAKHDLQNINTALYVASFLLVAAAALFISTTTLSESLKFVGVWLITLIFYITGLILYQTVEKLRPAAVAFTDTGLALLPFTGIAMYNSILPDAAVCWFITSLVSLAAFTYATVCLKNQVLSYLTLAFGVSLSASSVATLDVGLIWYFVATIVFGSLMTILSAIKPSWIPEYFSKPIQKTNHWIVPLTIIASLFAANAMTIRDYWIISLVSTFYYGAVAASSAKTRDTALFVVRLLASLTAILMAYDLSDSSWVAVGLTVTFIGMLQSVISTNFLPKHDTSSDQNGLWLWLGFGMQLIAPMFVMNDESWAILVTAQLLIMLTTSFSISYMLRRASLSSFGTIALAFLPYIIGFHVFVPALEEQWVSLPYIILAAFTTAILSYKKFVDNLPSIRPYLQLNFGIFLVESLIFTSAVSDGWGIALWSIGTLLAYCMMYIEKQPWISIVANLMILTTIIRFVEPKLDSHWISLIFIVLATASIAFLYMEKYIKTTVVIRPYIIANFVLFIIEVLAFTQNVSDGWGLGLWSAATILTYALMYLESQPWLSIVSNAMIWIAVTRYVSPNIESYWVALIFMIFALISLAFLSIEKYFKTPSSTRLYLTANFSLFAIESLILTSGMDKEWGLFLWSTASASTYCLTYLLRIPLISIVANAVSLISIIRLVDILEISYEWKGIVVAWITLVLFYAAYWLLKTSQKNQYTAYFWWFGTIFFGVINLFGLQNSNESIITAAGLGLLVEAFIIALEGWTRNKYIYYDAAAIIATIGLQRIVNISAPELDLLLYTHWWALVFAGLGYLYYAANNSQSSKIRTIIAFSIISYFSGSAALGAYGTSDVPYRLIFLMDHIFILVVGSVLSKKLYTTWGAVGIILAVLWMLAGYTYLLLAFAALLLIAVAIYALVKQSKNTK